MRSAMQWMIVDDLMVCVTSAETPDAPTVASFLDDLRTKPVRRMLAMPFSASDALDEERKACGELCASKNIQVALMVEPAQAAAYAAFAALTSNNVSAFSWDDVGAAVAHLDLNEPHAARAMAALATMRRGRAAIAA